ncbi:MAG TPA: sugar phosphate isomerase/epimerase [Blastocatellia bacterium]|nr:sugar phosphate isomerase/epimerase [Blastocatellia bacterium]
MNRRSFVINALAGAAGSLCLTKSTLMASTLRSRKLKKIGLQLYTVRRELEKDFEGTIAKVAAAGYSEVEFAGYFNHTPQQVKSVLARNNLTAPSAHIPIVALRGDLQQTIDAAKTIGHEYLICAYLLPEERKTLDDYKRVTELFNSAGERLKKAGLQFGYHNHDFEFVPIDGKVPYDLILAETDPKAVIMEMDLYWITKAGQSPFKYFSTYPGRFHLVHVKDMDATPKRFFTEVGRGVIDFKKIFAQSDKAGIKHYFVEQDETPGSPFDSIKTSAEYLKQLEF